MTVTITGRSDAFTTLAELAQRLATAMPIKSRFDPYSTVKVVTKVLPKLAIRLASATVIRIRRRLDQNDVEQKLRAEEKWRIEMISKMKRIPPIMMSTTGHFSSFEVNEEKPALQLPYKRAQDMVVLSRPHTKFATRAPRATRTPRATRVRRARRANTELSKPLSDVSASNALQILNRVAETGSLNNNVPRGWDNSKCYVCNRQFGDSLALRDHKRDSIKHKKKIERNKRELADA